VDAEVDGAGEEIDREERSGGVGAGAGDEKGDGAPKRGCAEPNRLGCGPLDIYPSVLAKVNTRFQLTVKGLILALALAASASASAAARFSSTSFAYASFLLDALKALIQPSLR